MIPLRSAFVFFAANCLCSLASTLLEAAPSYYTAQPPDTGAVLFSSPRFAVHGDGINDDADALQQAIDSVADSTRQGVVLVPEGTYRLGKTIHVWSGIRLVGFGTKRPVFRLADKSPGFQDGEGKYLLHFVSDKPETPGAPLMDANPGTFYSALNNIDLNLGSGNPAAIGVRFHVAQHGFIAHVEFTLGDARAGIEEIGNEAEDCRFLGGDFGIITHKPSPSWPFFLADAVFEDQRVAGIETEEAGLTLLRAQFRHMPSAIRVREQRIEELVMQDSRLEDISGPALVLGEEQSPRLQVNLRNLVCAQVPVLVQFRESGKRVEAPAPLYSVPTFTHGLQLVDNEEPGPVRTHAELVPLQALPPLPSSDLPSLPPVQGWASARDFGAKGDGTSDDTAALRRALASTRTVFLPTGRYLINDTLQLRADSVLVGLNPIRAQLVLQDQAPAFDEETEAPAPQAPQHRRSAEPSPKLGPPKAVLETAPGGSTILTGIGIDSGQNPRAVALKWTAGTHSLVNDVRFLGGHGTYRPDGSEVPVYNANRSGDPDPRRRWDSQYPSLWVTEGGGGTLKDIWTPNTFAQAGVLISDTKTPGRIYALSSEHHLRNEIIFRNVANWSLYALQTEEERAEGEHTLPLSIEGCQTLQFFNLYLYRVMSSFAPAPCAIRVSDSSDLHFNNVHLYGPSKFNFDATLLSQAQGIEVRAREIASLTLTGKAATATPSALPACVELGASVQREIGGFNNIDNTVTDSKGRICFIDARNQRLLRWDPSSRELRTLLDAPIEPVSLAIDKSDNLLIVTRTGSVFALPSRGTAADLRRLEPEPAAPGRGLPAILPLTRWLDEHSFLHINTASHGERIVSPDRSVAIPVPENFLHAGYWSSYYSTIDLIRAYALGTTSPGESFCVADEFAQKTYLFTPAENGTLVSPRLIAQDGEAGVALDKEGTVFIAAGQVLVYSSDGRRLGTIPVPERPSSLSFGGPDRKTLYIAARSSLYSIRMRVPGR